MDNTNGKRQDTSLGRRLFSWFLIIATVPLLVVSAVSYYTASRSLTEHAQEELFAIGDVTEKLVIRTVSDQLERAQIVAQGNAFRDLLENKDADKTEDLTVSAMARIATISSSYNIIRVADAEGKIILTQDRQGEGQDISANTAFVEAKEKRRPIMEDIIENGIRTGFKIYAPVFSEGNNQTDPIGMLITESATETLNKVLTEIYNNLGDTGDVFIIN